MLELLNTKIFDNERNILNADLFVNNLKHTFKAFKFNTKITYEVYRNITIYHITWNDDKNYEDMLELKKEIALALGVTTNEFEIEKEKENEVKIKVQNMKKSTLSLKELLEESKDKDNNNKSIDMIGNFPTLDIGENTITWVGNITKLDISPRIIYR